MQKKQNKQNKKQVSGDKDLELKCTMIKLSEALLEITHLSNNCLMTRKQRPMGTAAQRSCGLGNTFPSWSFKSAQPWPSGNQIQSAHSCSLSLDNILTEETDRKRDL